MEGILVGECLLECERGTCAKRYKLYNKFSRTGPFPVALAFDILSSGGGHCACPNGYTGLHSKVAVRACGPGKHCYNGATCTYNGRSRDVCNGNAAHTNDVSYAGAGCE